MTMNTSVLNSFYPSVITEIQLDSKHSVITFCNKHKIYKIIIITFIKY